MLSAIKGLRPDMGATTFSRIGIPADPNEQGTHSNVDDNNGAWMRWDTNPVAGSVGGFLFGGFDTVRADWESSVVIRMVSPSALNALRIWVGLFGADPSGNDAPTTVHLAAFRYAPPTDTTAFWRCVSGNGATLQVTTTTVTITTATEYLLKIWHDVVNSAWKFYIDGTLVATHQTNIPGTGNNLGAGLLVTTKANAAKNLTFGWLALAHE